MIFARADARIRVDESGTYFGVAPKFWTYLDREETKETAGLLHVPFVETRQAKKVLQAVQFADIPVMSTYLMLIALFFVGINLAVDLLYYLVDPRLRADRAGPERGV